MQPKKATIIKVSKLPWVSSFKSLGEAIRNVSFNMAKIHAKEVAKVMAKGSR